MKPTVRFLAAAEAEIDEAIVWYENQSQGLGADTVVVLTCLHGRGDPPNRDRS